MPKDNKAIYGSKQRWFRQLNKQAEHGKRRAERLHGEVINDEEEDD